MKEMELRNRAKCSVCEQLIGHTGLPLFWTVRIERHGVRLDVVRRQDGLAQMLGSSELAQVMGPDPEMTEPIMEPVEITVCEDCAFRPVEIASLAGV